MRLRICAYAYVDQKVELDRLILMTHARKFDSLIGNSDAWLQKLVNCDVDNKKLVTSNYM